MHRIRAAGLVLVVTLIAVLGCTAAAPAAPWLFVTDIHYDPVARGQKPARDGSDTNAVLLNDTLTQMKRVDPDPPVVVIGGDYLAHNFDWKRAAVTMRYLARRFNAAFPRAQFVIALGNEDSPCGDYSLVPRSTFLRETAQAWAPLVNRNGAAPGFAATFARDGFYTARLPVAHLRAIVIDDVFWSPRYRACGPAEHPAATVIDELSRALHASSDRHWIVLHIPPGIDAFSTAHLVHHLIVIPFMDPRPRDALLQLIADPASNVALVVAAHTHKFAYRIAGTPARPVPILLVPSVSPIFGNDPGFLTAEVDSDGILRNVDTWGFQAGHWDDLGGFNALGVERLTGDALVDLQRRLTQHQDLRARFMLLYQGGAPSEISASNWSTYWCSATAFTSTTFRKCTEEGGYSIFTSRGIIAGACAVVAAAGGAIALLRRRRRKRLARSSNSA